MSNPTTIPCPICKTAVEMNDKFPHRPFCTERCKMIDFGDWATEANRVACESLEDNVWSADLEKYDDTDFKL